MILTQNNIKSKNILNKLIYNTNKKLNFEHNLRENKSINKIKNILYQKILSSKETIPDFFEINNGKNKNGKEEQKVSESSNSIFEDYTNKSIDSSFLGSSLNDKFYNDLITKK